jgi:phage terminase Nu1 subunit (DNA packaging protein)|tara:strand:+ start:794 stop:1063 length:270 start_codon:yes stop_codon:yes gene_type:complete
MALTSREGFASWYAAFIMAHTVLEVDLDDMGEEFKMMFNSVIDTVWQSKYPDLTHEDVQELKEDLNMEMMQIQTILDEAIKSHKMGERV